MYIVYVGAFRLPNLDAAAPRVINNAKALRAAGCDVSFISWGGKYRAGDLCDDGKYRVDGFEYVITDELDASGFINKVKSRLFRGRKSLSLISRMEIFPDLIITYNADYSWTKAVMRFCLKHNIKFANDITEWYSNNEIRLADIIPNALNMKYLQHRVSNKIVISSMLDTYYSESNNLLLPPLCDLCEPKWNKTITDERIKPFDGITLIYAGNPAKKDCLHAVVSAVNKLAEEGNAIRFLVLGITRSAYMQRYSQLLVSKSLHENILFLGRVPQDLVPAYYKKADFMILLRKPTRKNMAGFPTKFAESMTAGVPVITNATSDIPNYVIDGETGFLTSGCDIGSILHTLKSDILPIRKNDIEKMKVCVLSMRFAFDWHSRIMVSGQFLKKLK